VEGAAGSSEALRGRKNKWRRKRKGEGGAARDSGDKGSTGDQRLIANALKAAENQRAAERRTARAAWATHAGLAAAVALGGIWLRGALVGGDGPS
jgi:hypothetical protein